VSPAARPGAVRTVRSGVKLATDARSAYPEDAEVQSNDSAPPARRKARTRPQLPRGVVEVLRLLTVVFFAGLGYQTAQGVGSRGGILGPFNAVATGVIVGSGIGYVAGGVVGRIAVSTADRTEAALRQTSADTLVAGGMGMILGVLAGAGLGWPLFFVPQPLIAIPLFAFVVIVLGYVGYRLGVARREEFLDMFGHRAGIAPRPAPTVAIDGRIIEVVRAGFLHGPMLVPTAVVGELQGLADAADEKRRARGRRGQEVLAALHREPAVQVSVIDDGHPEVPEVDAKLVRVCLDRQAALLTLDSNLARSAALAGASVANLHALALALRPPVTAGDEVHVLLTKPGKEPGQAVGYLDDGTMVVVEHARERVGHELAVRVTSVLTSANGRMVFAQPAVPTPRRHPVDET
jgi:uncharacterized protein YacL